MHLADVNVLIALVDQTSPSHDAAHDWLLSRRESGWCTCPTTENGFVRIISNPRYQSGAVTVAEALQTLVGLRKVKGHSFLASDYSITDHTQLFGQLAGHNQVTDLYLVELAGKHNAKLATFDNRMKYLPAQCQAHIEYL